MSAEVPIIELKGASKEYPAVPEPVKVLRNIDFQLDAGRCIAIVGPSGCGKSTLLNLMGALDTATSGQVMFKGRDLSGLSERELARLRNRELGFVFQQHHLLPQCTVLENVLVPALIAPGSRSGSRSGGRSVLPERTRSDACPSIRVRSGRTDLPDARDRALELLDRVGLGDRLDHRPGQLSGGECQRAAVVRALINRPSLLLADEPTGSLNQENAERLADLILELNRQEGMAVAVVTHALSIAERMGRVFELRGGRLAPPV